MVESLTIVESFLKRALRVAVQNALKLKNNGAKRERAS
jgi:hypothetical protein